MRSAMSSHDLPVELSSSDTRIVIGDSYFESVTANGVGTAVLTARCDTATVDIPITVTAAP